MVLLDHARRRFKAEVTQEDMDQLPLMNLSTPPTPQVPPLSFIPDSVMYISYNQLMTPATRGSKLFEGQNASRDNVHHGVHKHSKMA